MFCTNCGNKVNEKADVCLSCGKNIVETRNKEGMLKFSIVNIMLFLTSISLAFNISFLINSLSLGRIYQRKSEMPDVYHRVYPNDLQSILALIASFFAVFFSFLAVSYAISYWKKNKVHINMVLFSISFLVISVMLAISSLLTLHSAYYLGLATLF